MSDGGDGDQEANWELLYGRIRAELQRFGSEDYRVAADCWVDDDNIGTLQHKVYVRNLNLLKPEVVTALQTLLSRFPTWEIMIAVSMRVRGKQWPDMGLTVRADEIIDGLQRSYFPPEFRQFRYERSRSGTDRD
jgi:hypothetical protein